MINESKAVRPEYGLLEKTRDEFLRAVKLIEKLDDDIFSSATKVEGSVGAHIRHNIEIAENFLYGLRAGKIDYANRQRDIRIERERGYAIERTRCLIGGFRDLPGEIFRIDVLVRSEVELEVWHASSVSRELEFIHSHTVHHHAIIAEKLKAVGIEVSADFGVAPSTLAFWKRSAA